jgi:hypothetical protein
MKELARGLVDSEYWELIRVVLISDLEAAKSMLEEPSISDKDFRVKQGEAKALRSAHNFIVRLGTTDKEESNGEK